LIASIPYFGLTTYNLPIPGLGSLPLDPWAILVCFGFVFGLEVGRARAIKLGMDVKDIVDGAVVTVATGFVVGHFFTVFFYFPERLADEGIWALLKLWTGFSSMGGFVGAVLGSVVFYTLIRKRPYWRYADVISFGFPFGWLFGRMGCGVVHDHIGAITTQPWGMNFDEGMRNFSWLAGDPYRWADGIRHELGLYEMIYMIPVCGLWLWLARKDRPPGFFTALFGAVYMPVRFVLDFFRNADLSHQDVRYWALTPAQWGCLVFFAVCLFILYRLDWAGFKPWPMDSLPNQAARAMGSAVDDGP
jgi:phosphatidylglycerol:prolipoprotein diacylglycerol transferase